MAPLNIVTIVEANRASYAPYRKCIIEYIVKKAVETERFDDILLAARAKCRSERALMSIEFLNHDLEMQNAILEKFPWSPHVGMTVTEFLDDFDTKLKEDAAEVFVNHRTPN